MIESYPDIEAINGREFMAVEQDGYDVRIPLKVLSGKKEYAATLNQTGTDDPVATELQNTFGSIVWTRFAANVFRATLTGAFPAANTLPFTLTRIDDDILELAATSPLVDLPVYFTSYYYQISPKPTTFVATAIDDIEIDLTWDTGADSYQLERSLDSELWQEIYKDATNSYDDLDREELTQYYYRLKAKYEGKDDSAYVYANATTTGAS